MLAIVGVLAFIAALLISIMIHEAGHFLTARHYGMKVTEFFLGFGARLWSTQRGETEFGIKAIPAGGYCKIVGMVESEELTPEEAPRAFYAASAPRRLVVLGAGSFLHFVLAYILLVGLFGIVGINSVTSTIDHVSPCVTPVGVSSSGAVTCPKGSLPSPALAAGLKSGDVIVSIDGKTFTDWNAAVTTIRSSANKSLLLGVKRSGTFLTIPITPVARTINGSTTGAIGIINKVGTIHLNPWLSLTNGFTLGKEIFTGSISSLISLPGKIPALFEETFGGKPRDPQGPVGVVGVARVSAQAVSASGLSWADRMGQFILIIASLNIFVGIFNLLPLLPLDGGHMLVAVIDGYRRTRARRRGLPTPAPFNVELLTPITMVVFILLAALTLMLLVADIFNPIHLNM
jgi:membrane-associated protease RseP (regulator of RpoE activity)